ncbi:hypothetical protein D3C80_1576250 [compost metagenome]
MTASTDHADHVPVGLDLHLVCGHYRHARQRLAAIRLDAYADQRGAHAAAAKLPAAADDVAAINLFRRLGRKDATGEHHIRRLGPDLVDGFRRQRRQVGRVHAEAGDPAGRAVRRSHRLDHLQELER